MKFDAASWNLPDNFNITKLYPHPKDSFSKKVLKNYPFARKGYIFNSNYIQEYFDKQDWYSPNPDYKATLKSLSKEEQEWVLKWSD